MMRLWAFATFFCFWAAATGFSLEAQPIHILPLGDSITQGGRADRQEYTYRYPLFYLLKESGYDVDFIGSLQTGLSPEAKWPAKNGIAFDPDHEGHYGWKTAAVRDQLAKWLSGYPAAPDIALIQLGTNDQGAADYNAAIIKPMQDMIALLRGKNPRVKIFIGHLLFNDGAALKIRPLVDAMCKQITTAESPVLAVNLFSGWIENPDKPNADTFDWAHPNPRGQEKMAQGWFAALKPALDELKNGK